MATAYDSCTERAWLCVTTARLCNFYQAGDTPYASKLILYSEAI